MHLFIIGPFSPPCKFLTFEGEVEKNNENLGVDVDVHNPDVF